MGRALLAAAMTLVLLGAPSTFTSGTRAATKTSITIVNVSGSLWTCSFNPYGSSSAGLSAGIFYEPLYYVNAITNKSRPWLATRYRWSNGNRTLTFTLRSGVKWTDGQALTPADVVFTFNLLKKYSALDLNAIWTVLSRVRASGNNIVITFKKPSVPYFYYLADQVFIVPQHIWSKLGNPVTYTDKSPVGSGPFKLGSCSPQNIRYVKNTGYWQPGKPAVTEVNYPAFMDNQPGNLYLARGLGQWGGQYIPNVKAYYLAKDPKNRHIWYPASNSNVSLYPNLKAWPTNILAVRQAISLGIDRAKVSRLGVYGYLPPANQHGILLPSWKSWYDSSLDRKFNYAYNPSKAISVLQKAGFKRGSDGIFRDPKGKKLTIGVLNVGGFTDWVAEVSLIAQSLKSVGIEIKPENVSGDTHTAREQSGNYQLTYEQPSGGPTPYYQFRQWLFSGNTAPIGKNAPSNFERYRNPLIDRALNRYSATTSSRVQHQVIRQIQRVMVQSLPVIPVLESISWYQYDTTNITGWPTPSNPYANPAPYSYPDWEVVLTTIKPR